MNSGRLRHPITIQEFTETINDAGESVKTWTTFHKCFADIIAGNSREFQQAQAVNASLTHIVKIRWKEGVLPKMRILWGSRILHISQPPLTDRTDRKKMRMDCIEEID